VQFGQRAEQLESHSVLLGVARVLHANPVSGAGAPQQLADVQRTMADVHGFEELRLLGRLRITKSPRCPRSTRLSSSGSSAERACRRSGGSVSPTIRDGPRSTPPQWRPFTFGGSGRKNPLLDRATSRACEIAARSAEGIVQVAGRERLSSQGSFHT
jgi:hypothetical protein